MELFDLLDAEWHRSIAHDPTLARRLPDLLAVTGGQTLHDAAGWIAGAIPEDADQALQVLARLAAGGDDLAARVLLQRLLPGARRLARRWWAIRDTEERAAITVAAVWARIRSYPIDRRPEKIAANVLLDAAVDLRRTAAADRRFPECSGLRIDERKTDPIWLHPAVELTETLTDAVAAGVVSRADASLIIATRIQGRSLREATPEQVAVRTLQWRRKRAETALATSRQAA